LGLAYTGPAGPSLSGGGVAMIPRPAPLPLPRGQSSDETAAVWDLTGPAPSFHRNHRPPLPPPAAPRPSFEVENLGRRAEPYPNQSLRRQQRDVMAGGLVNFDEVALPEILDPRRVERQHSPPPFMFLNCPRNPHGSWPGQPPISPRAKGCCRALAPFRPIGRQNRSRKLTLARTKN
jgi:hypothetical protein